jgi:SAM-dependent methyltransferase
MIRHRTLLADEAALGHDADRMRTRRPKVVAVPGGSGPPQVAPEWPVNARDFAAYYRFAPAALALRECARLRAVRDIELEEPILDVGCGDGLFARLAYPGRQTWGIDINPSEVQRAQTTQAYSTLICGNICAVDLPKQFFSSAIANCSLEHVPDLRGALANIRGTLKPGSRFVLIVPTPNWTSQLATVELLERVGLHGLARAYGDGLDKVFSHIHLHDETAWVTFLEEAGFDQIESRPIVDRGTSWAFDLMLYPSLLAYLTKKLTGRWVLFPGLRLLTVDAVRGALNSWGGRVAKGDVPGEFLLTCRARPEGPT